MGTIKKYRAMVKEILWDVTGGVGCLMAIIFPTMEQIEQFARVCGIFLGIILAVVSIIHKLLEIRKLKYGSKSKTTRTEDSGIDSENS